MGITGWVHHRRDLRDERLTIARMSAAIGGLTPVRRTIWLGRHAGIAVRDGATGADWRHPQRLDPDVLVAVDGRITNRERLAAQLGHHVLAGDADLVLRGYREWGAGLAHRIDGDCAIAIWDNQRRQLLLIADTLGQRTWFYQPQEHGILFATHARALLAHPGVPAQVTTSGLADLITLGPARTPGQAVIHGVRELTAGQLLTATPESARVGTYWQWHADPHTHDPEVTARLLRRLLADVTAPLRRDPPGAVLLSGGLSSAAVAALTGEPDHRPDAFTLTLSDEQVPAPGGRVDVRAAARTAAHMAMTHRHVGLRLDDLTTTAGPILDFPGDGTTDIPLFALLRRLAQHGVHAVVTGDGADGVLGGYPWLHRRDPTTYETFPWLQPPMTVDRLLSTDARAHLQPDTYLRQRWTDATSHTPVVAGETAAARAHRRLAYLALTRYLPGQLRRLTQLATAAGLTVHTPIADFVLAQYALNIPPAVRHPGGRRNGLLRTAVADLLPAEVSRQPSTSFPSADLLPGWRRQQHDRLRDVLTDTTQPLQPLLDPARVAPLRDQPTETLPRALWPAISHLLEVNAWLARHHLTLP